MEEINLFVSDSLARLADPAKARHMAAYMKTDMPFYGVQSGPRREIANKARRRFAPASQEQYEDAVAGLWALPHREEKYLAVALARLWGKYVNADSLPLYERMVREGAWWDFVDEIAQHLMGGALAKEPDRVWPTMDAWINDPDLWIRRSAILCQNRFKESTDHERLFTYCLARAHEEEFFMRKAIGWALRQYARVEPERVRSFLLAHGERLSGLSLREAAKHLDLG